MACVRNMADNHKMSRGKAGNNGTLDFEAIL
jgi:hypothetical protein